MLKPTLDQLKQNLPYVVTDRNGPTGRYGLWLVTHAVNDYDHKPTPFDHFAQAVVQVWFRNDNDIPHISYVAGNSPFSTESRCDISAAWRFWKNWFPLDEQGNIIAGGLLWHSRPDVENTWGGADNDVLLPDHARIMPNGTVQLLYCADGEPPERYAGMTTVATDTVAFTKFLSTEDRRYEITPDGWKVTNP